MRIRRSISALTSIEESVEEVQPADTGCGPSSNQTLFRTVRRDVCVSAATVESGIHMKILSFAGEELTDVLFSKRIVIPALHNKNQKMRGIQVEQLHDREGTWSITVNLNVEGGVSGLLVCLFQLGSEVGFWGDSFVMTEEAFRNPILRGAVRLADESKTDEESSYVSRIVGKVKSFNRSFLRSAIEATLGYGYDIEIEEVLEVHYTILHEGVNKKNSPCLDLGELVLKVVMYKCEGAAMKLTQCLYSDGTATELKQPQSTWMTSLDPKQILTVYNVSEHGFKILIKHNTEVHSRQILYQADGSCKSSPRAAKLKEVRVAGSLLFSGDGFCILKDGGQHQLLSMANLRHGIQSETPIFDSIQLDGPIVDASLDVEDELLFVMNGPKQARVADLRKKKTIQLKEGGIPRRLDHGIIIWGSRFLTPEAIACTYFPYESGLKADCLQLLGSLVGEVTVSDLERFILNMHLSKGESNPYKNLTKQLSREARTSLLVTLDRSAVIFRSRPLLFRAECVDGLVTSQGVMEALRDLSSHYEHEVIPKQVAQSRKRGRRDAQDGDNDPVDNWALAMLDERRSQLTSILPVARAASAAADRCEELDALFKALLVLPGGQVVNRTNEREWELAWVMQTVTARSNWASNEELLSAALSFGLGLGMDDGYNARRSVSGRPRPISIPSNLRPACQFLHELLLSAIAIRTDLDRALLPWQVILVPGLSSQLVEDLLCEWLSCQSEISSMSLLQTDLFSPFADAVLRRLIRNAALQRGAEGWQRPIRLLKAATMAVRNGNLEGWKAEQRMRCLALEAMSSMEGKLPCKVFLADETVFETSSGEDWLLLANELMKIALWGSSDPGGPPEDSTEELRPLQGNGEEYSSEELRRVYCRVLLQSQFRAHELGSFGQLLTLSDLTRRFIDEADDAAITERVLLCMKTAVQAGWAEPVLEGLLSALLGRTDSERCTRILNTCILPQLSALTTRTVESIAFALGGRVDSPDYSRAVASLCSLCYRQLITDPDQMATVEATKRLAYGCAQKSDFLEALREIDKQRFSGIVQMLEF